MLSERKVNILLVDDRPENLIALEAILDRLGQNLVKACSGEQALKCLLNLDFALILLDVEMPGIDGFETAMLIRQRERSRNTPIVFLTALSGGDKYMLKGYALGAVDYLTKPIDPAILISKVGVFVELFQKTMEVKQQANQLSLINTELKTSEQRFRSLSACAPVGIFLSDETGRCTYSNPNCQAICGLKVNDSWENKCKEFIHPEDRDRVLANWCRCDRTLVIYCAEFRIYAPDGTLRWVCVRTSPMLSESRELTGYVGTIEDITEFKQAEEENFRMGAELKLARKLQQMLLPKPEELRGIDGLDIAAFMEPADEIGGDYYDVLCTDGVVTLAIGDVTGHGLESGILMLMTQTGVRTLKEIRERDPVKFLNTLNRTIYQNVQRMNSQRNLSLAILNYADGKISISGQHEEILVVRSQGEVERIDTIDLGLPIGLDEEIANFIDHILVELSPGDGVVLYTDGITEAKNIYKNRYGIERLCKIVSQNWQHSTQQIQRAVIDDVRRHIGKQKVFDDITLVVLKLRNNFLE
jgi:PAS domain S-box-containing protein